MAHGKSSPRAKVGADDESGFFRSRILCVSVLVPCTLDRARSPARLIEAQRPSESIPASIPVYEKGRDDLSSSGGVGFPRRP
jgi:hypothetical protein